MDTTEYYIYKEYFGYMDRFPKDDMMPRDVKRIYRHGKYIFNERYYFISESTKMIYRYYEVDDRVEIVYHNKIATKCDRFYLVPDYSSVKNRNIRDIICITDKLLKRIHEMNIIDLECVRKVHT